MGFKRVKKKGFKKGLGFRVFCEALQLGLSSAGCELNRPGRLGWVQEASGGDTVGALGLRGLEFRV